MEQALTMAPGLLAGIGMRLSGVIGAAKGHDRPDPVVVANALQTREGQLAAAIEDPGPNHTEIPPMWMVRPSVQKRPAQDTDEQGDPEHKPDAMSHNETSVPPCLFARWTSNVPSPLQFVCAGAANDAGSIESNAGSNERIGLDDPVTKGANDRKDWDGK
jgi:hypothetical protein